MVPGSGHVRLPARDGRELVVELLQDHLVGVFAFGLAVLHLLPLVRVPEVSRVQHELGVVEVGHQA